MVIDPEQERADAVADVLAHTSVESTIRKKMAAVHFTTIPCEPN